MEVATMERLYFSCPTTGLKVDPGIESELGTLLQIRGEQVTAHCPHCGQTHTWHVGDAQLERTRTAAPDAEQPASQ